MPTEHTPLLEEHATNYWNFTPTDEDNLHSQFCKLVGVPPSDLRSDEPRPDIPGSSLYGRATKRKRYQDWVYISTAIISNSLLLTQVVLGAAVTGLGASESSHVLITVFGALNTIIAGVVAYLKSRGQPMRSRMFRDDLERVVGEIESSEIMWRGISTHAHGYDEIDIKNNVTVRSEVARLTRLYDKAVINNTNNSPDFYQADRGAFGPELKLRAGGAALTFPPIDHAPAAAQSGAVPPPVVAVIPDVDSAPATQVSPKKSISPTVPKATEDSSPATAADPNQPEFAVSSIVPASSKPSSSKSRNGKSPAPIGSETGDDKVDKHGETSETGETTETGKASSKDPFADSNAHLSNDKSSEDE